MARLCVALDVGPREAIDLVETLSKERVAFKVGPVLLLRGGPGIVKRIKELGREVFLDLKLHDIPRTVGESVRWAEDLGADFLTLHTIGGREMIRSAVSSAKRLKLLGVTVLTSHGEEYLSLFRSGFGSLEEFTLHLARIAEEEGLYGVVCSGEEVSRIKEETRLFTVVPGVRVGSLHDDHRRVCTPKRAVDLGADMVVMGREVIRSEDPLRTVRYVLETIGD